MGLAQKAKNRDVTRTDPVLRVCTKSKRRTNARSTGLINSSTDIRVSRMQYN